MQQREEEAHVGALILMEWQWQEAINDLAKKLMVMEGGGSTNGDLDVMVNSWRCWHKRSQRKMVKFKSCRRKMKGWQNYWKKHINN